MIADFKKTIINVLKEIKLSNIGFLLLIILFLIVALPTLTPKLFSSLPIAFLSFKINKSILMKNVPLGRRSIRMLFLFPFNQLLLFSPVVATYKLA